MQHKIEKGVKPYKIVRNGSGRPLKYPWDKMKSGDSIPFGKKEAVSARMAAYAYGRRHTITFISRKEKSGVRIWRL